MVITQKETLFSSVCRWLEEENINAYLVGGAVRDMLLGRDTGDIDIAVAGDALAVASRIAATIGGVYVPLDTANGIGRTVVKDPATGTNWTFDFSSLRDTIGIDLTTRDFTIDALAVNLGHFAGKDLCFNGLARELLDIPVIDPLHGQDDLQQGIIRAVSQSAFRADPIRLLRAVRLVAELNFTIDTDTEALIKRDAGLLTGVTGERIHEELLRLVAVPGSAGPLRYLDELGLLMAMIPELIPTRETTQPREHYWKVLDHSLNTAMAVEYILHRGDWPYDNRDIRATVPWSAELDRHFSEAIGHLSNRASLLKIAALLHDIAKPQTKALTEKGRTRFIGHDREGTVAATAILERLRFSTREIKTVALYIRYHLRPTQLTQEALPTRRALYRYFRDTGDTAIDILFLSLADHLATRGPLLDLPLWEEHTKLVEYTLAQFNKTETLVKPPRLVDGHDLINIFGMQPGPRIGELLETVREAHAAGEITTRQEALDYIRNTLKDRTG